MIENIFSNLRNYIEAGQVISYLAVFLSGIIICFTPCVYPLIPITIGYIGAATTSKSRGFILSFVYVLGISITYSVLGLIASLTGRIFGQIATHPISFIVVGSVFVIFGLFMAGFIKFRLPSIFTKQKFKQGNPQATLFNSLIIGLVAGLVIGPCTAPALGVILTYVATKQSIVYGSSLLFIFAFGMGFPLIILGTFTALLSNLPKAGNWMIKVQKIFSFILIAAGIYFLIKGIMNLI